MRGLASCFKSGTNLIGEGNNEKPGEESRDFSPGSFFALLGGFFAFGRLFFVEVVEPRFFFFKTLENKRSGLFREFRRRRLLDRFGVDHADDIDIDRGGFQRPTLHDGVSILNSRDNNGAIGVFRQVEGA